MLALVVALLGDCVEYCAFRAAWVAGSGSLVGVLHAHCGEVLHAVRAFFLAVTAAPRLVPIFALLVVHEAVFFRALELLNLAAPTPITFRLLAVVGIVLEVRGAHLCTKSTSALVTFITLRIASVEAHLLVMVALFKLLSTASAEAVAPACFTRVGLLLSLWCLLLLLLWLLVLVPLLGLRVVLVPILALDRLLLSLRLILGTKVGLLCLNFWLLGF